MQVVANEDQIRQVAIMLSQLAAYIMSKRKAPDSVNVQMNWVVSLQICKLTQRFS